MNTQRTIEQKETELKELLQRVMQAPLDPITSSVQKLDRHLTVLEDLEEQIVELRDLDLAALKHTTDESNKCIRSIKLLVEYIPTDLQNRLKALLTQEFEELQKAYHSGLGKVEIHLKEQTLELRTVDLAALKHTTDESNKFIRSIKSLVEDIPTDLQNRLKPLLTQELEEFQKAYQSGLEKVEIHLKGHIDAAQRLANENGTRLQTVIEFQQGQILQLLRQNESGAIQLKNELSHAHARVKHWLVVNVLLAGAGFIGIATLATRLYF